MKRFAMPVLATALALSFVPAHAQGWPTRPVRLVVPYVPAGTTDIVARLVGQRLAETLGQPFVIDNRGGAGATIGSDIVAKAPPDGYTMLLCTVASHGISPSLYKRVGYDPVRDFAHISILGNAPTVLEVNPKLPVQDFAAFVAYARANHVAFATSGAGSSNHIAGALLNKLAGIEMTHVPYRGSGAALIDVIDGQVPAMFDTLTSSAGHIKAGKLRPLATGGETRHPSLPDVPTFIELGYPRMLFVSWFGLCTPAGLPADILSKLSVAVTEALKSDEVKARFAEVSFTTQPTTPAEFTAFVREEVARWAVMIQEVGATAD